MHARPWHYQCRIGSLHPLFLVTEVSISSCSVGRKYGEHLSAPVTPCRMLVSVRMKLSWEGGAANSWAKVKAVNTKADSQGSSGRAVSIYYTADKRIPRRCFQLWNNSSTLGMNKLQSQVRSVQCLRVLLALCLQLMKREGDFSGFLPRQKKKQGGRREGNKIKTRSQPGSKQI